MRSVALLLASSLPLALLAAGCGDNDGSDPGSLRVQLVQYGSCGALEDDLKPLNVTVPIPDTLVLDGSNRLVAHFDKVVEREELEAAIQRALAAG